MEEKGLSSSALNRTITQLTNRSAADADHPIENLLPYSAETAPGNLAKSLPSKPVPASEDMQETKGGCIRVPNRKPKEESSGSDVQQTQLDVESGGSTGFGFGCSLEIVLIDDTAVIDFGRKNNKQRRSKAKKDTPGRKKEFEAKKDTAGIGRKKGSEAKKPRRRSSKAAAKKGSDYESRNASNFKAGKRTKIVYSRKEMEALRFCNLKGQRKLWQKVYNAFPPTVRTEYDDFGGFRHQHKQSGFIWNANRAPALLGMNYYGNCRVLYGEGGNNLNLSRGGGNYLNYYRGGGNCVNVYGCGRFTSS